MLRLRTAFCLGACLLDQFPKLNFKNIRNTKKAFKARTANASLDVADRGQAKTGFLGKLIFGETLLYSPVGQKVSQLFGDRRADVVL